MQINDNQWNLYFERYGKLMFTISRMMSGDLALANPEDNMSDLKIAAIESIRGFNVKTGQNFEEMMENKLFDQYTKTVLWNRKNKIGVKLTKRMPFQNKMVSIDAPIGEDEDSKFDLEDTRIDGSVSSMVLEDMFQAEDDDTKKVLKAIAHDPSVLDSHGNLKVYALLQPTGLTIHTVRKAVSKIERILNSKYEYQN